MCFDLAYIAAFHVRALIWSPTTQRPWMATSPRKGSTVGSQQEGFAGEHFVAGTQAGELFVADTNEILATLILPQNQPVQALAACSLVGGAPLLCHLMTSSTKPFYTSHFNSW